MQRLQRLLNTRGLVALRIISGVIRRPSAAAPGRPRCSVAASTAPDGPALALLVAGAAGAGGAAVEIAPAQVTMGTLINADFADER